MDYYDLPIPVLVEHGHDPQYSFGWFGGDIANGTWVGLALFVVLYGGILVALIFQKKKDAQDRGLEISGDRLVVREGKIQKTIFMGNLNQVRIESFPDGSTGRVVLKTGKNKPVLMWGST